MDDRDRREREAFREATEALIGRGDERDALALAEVRLRRVPGDPDARIAICRVRIRQGRLAEARETLAGMEETLVRLSPVYACLGDMHRREGCREEAESCYRKFLLLNPESPLAGELADWLEENAAARDESAAAEAMDDAAETTEDAGEVPADFQTLTLAELYIRQGHLAMAEEVLEAVLKRYPGQEKAAERLDEVREILHPELRVQRSAPVIGELNRWLVNIGRLRSHAG
jgi:tetratricopeptide (TPR) repeat protein